MIARLTPRPLRGEIAALPSKSQAHRALICAALAKGKTRIVCGQTGQDVEATVRCLRALGAEIEYDGTAYTVAPIAAPAQDARTWGRAGPPCGSCCPWPAPWA